MNVKIEKLGYGLTLFDKSNSYLLVIKKEEIQGDLGRIYFMIPSPCKIIKDTRIPVTARDTYEYPPQLFPIKTNYRYIEVGAGLSGFIPEIISRSLNSKPIVIDIFNYNAGYNLLEVAHKNSSLDQKKSIEKLMDRCKLITDPSRVNLINCSLGSAIKANPWLIGTADVVIDYCGPNAYPETEWHNRIDTKKKIEEQLKSKVRHLEKLLLNKGGNLITN